MSYTVMPVFNRQDLKAKTFDDKQKALRFMQKFLDQYNLQVNHIIKADDRKEYVCEGHESRVIIWKAN